MHKRWIVLGILLAAIFLHGCNKKSDSNAITMVIVGATNCESCGAVTETVDYLHAHNPSLHIKQVEIHTNEGAMYVTRYNLWRVPVYLFLDSRGSELYRIEGASTRQEIEDALVIAKTHLKKK
ncbi:MAG: thioredoxin family protein [Spirochaetota bacterium]